ncbi:hypothetical protein LY78DRAFT_423418 [Colletotrichum sublineola]|nr:hypothetical protein LY78DRAFT_423418 [Colletotrichum sublineola]
MLWKTSYLMHRVWKLSGRQHKAWNPTTSVGYRPTRLGISSLTAWPDLFMFSSTGPWVCWGGRLAYLELKVIVTLLVWELRFMQLSPKMKEYGLVELLLKPESCCVKLQSIASRT